MSIPFSLSPKLELRDYELPSLITWFNTFVGFKEIINRIERVEKKLESIDFTADVLARRYQFHRAYKDIVYRNRRHQKIDMRQIENYNVMSFLTASRAAHHNLSDGAKKRLRSSIIDALNPDRDFRAIEHEMRVFTHYRQNGRNVEFLDLEGRGVSDFLVSCSTGDTFEVEAKTVTEDCGSSITSENSIEYFLAFRAALSKVPTKMFGVLKLDISDKHRLSRSEITDILVDFLRSGSAEREFATCKVSFLRRDRWNPLQEQNAGSIFRRDVQDIQESENPHAMILVGKSSAVTFCVNSHRRSRLLKNMLRTIKNASEQLSSQRVGVIWIHNLGLTSDQFQRLSSENLETNRGAFVAFANYCFTSAARAHVGALILSAESASVETSRSKILHYSSPTTSVSQGPLLSLYSQKCRYPLPEEGLV